MRKSAVGFLVGAGVVLAWFFRGKILGRIFDRSITLTTKKDVCGIEEVPAPVSLSKILDDKIRWQISSPSATGCEGQRTVCIGNWRLDGVPADVPPVKNPEGLCRQVRRGGPPKQILGNIDYRAPLGEYTYDILVDDVVVYDPIVKLTL
ncbi:MAG TPA: hypothetical protein VFT24_02765 [Vicinamibacterales bacterium]|nr:hypothetical protein [Vicinamibacterales bacterium]